MTIIYNNNDCSQVLDDSQKSINRCFFVLTKLPSPSLACNRFPSKQCEDNPEQLLLPTQLARQAVQAGKTE